jgi:phosphoribosylamine---glycine ligase
MRILLIGSGGREHALAQALARSSRVDEVLIAPGNAGTALERKCRNLDIAATDLAGLLGFALRERIELTVVGPEAPLVLGIVDQFRAANLRIFGPTRAAAQLEGSKAFSKAFMARHGIPTARFDVFVDVAPALNWVRALGAPIVIKADGLAAGKGVVVASTLAEAEAAVHDMLKIPGGRIVVEEFLHGEEASFIVLADGQHALALASAQDHKRIHDGDQGPNTGGMGAYSPAPVVTAETHQRAMREVIEPTLKGMAAEGTPFTGFLYAGLMIAPGGRLGVLEFNARLGDPETQAILPRLKSDLVDLLDAALAGTLDQIEACWDPRPALGVVLAAESYPGTPVLGATIDGLDAVPDDVTVFHAGTRRDADTVRVAGGRVLCVTALGDTLKAAADSAYRAIAKVSWPGMQFRRDIGRRGMGWGKLKELSNENGCGL